jgi:hypothetical protein
MTAEADGEYSDDYWWAVAVNGGTSSKVGGVVLQREGCVLAAGRVGWEGGFKKVRVNESRGRGEQE